MKILLFILLVSNIYVLYGCKKSGETVKDDEKEVIIDPVINETAYAFPGAEGFGRFVTGGRGGKVIKVTNLNDAGAGSLRSAVEATGARIVVFDVSGTISLSRALDLRNGNITLAGQTAPGDGITIKNYPFNVKASSVIIRYMRFRMGDEQSVEADAIGGFEAKDIIVDHCSMSWSTDECVSFYNNDNFTLQWSIISESLRLSAHDKGAHGYGGIWGGKNASFHHNLMAHHDSRTPRFGEREGTAYALTDLVDVRNNVFYNWGNNGAYGGEAMNINIVNNYYKPGPATKHHDRIFSPNRYSKDTQSPIYQKWGKFFISGNYVFNRPNTTNDNWNLGVYNQIHSGEGTVSSTDKANMKLTSSLPIDNNVTTQTAENAYINVLAHVGASLKRDAVDSRVIETVKNGTFSAPGSNGSINGIIDKAADVGGWPFLNTTAATLDTDGDGMPDDWEIVKKLDPKKANANSKDLSTAYDNIEVY
ncbi:MAG: pectate lyase, partial [Pedobacter sp.]